MPTSHIILACLAYIYGMSKVRDHDGGSLSHIKNGRVHYRTTVIKGLKNRSDGYAHLNGGPLVIA